MKIEIRIQISQAGTHQFFSSRGNKSFAMQMMFPVPILPLIHLDRQTVWALESDPVHKSFLQLPYQGKRIFLSRWGIQCRFDRAEDQSVFGPYHGNKNGRFLPGIQVAFVDLRKNIAFKNAPDIAPRSRASGLPHFRR